MKIFLPKVFGKNCLKDEIKLEGEMSLTEAIINSHFQEETPELFEFSADEIIEIINSDESLDKVYRTVSLIQHSNEITENLRKAKRVSMRKRKFF